MGTMSKGTLSGMLRAGVLAAVAGLVSVGCAPEASEPEQTQQVSDGSSAAAPAVATVGQPAPAFELVDTEGVTHTLAQYTEAGKTVVLEWFNPQCPFVVKQYAHDMKRMNELEAAYADKGVVWLRVNSGGAGKQGHGQELNAKTKTDWSIAGPILLDESGEVGKAYKAKTTPHMYVIDGSGVLRYAGAVDNNRNTTPPSAEDRVYVREALDAVLGGGQPEVTENDPYGCGVKYAS